MTRFARTGIRFPHISNPVSYSPRQVATAYSFPLGKATGKGYVGGLIELGGGYDPAQLRRYFIIGQGLQTPTFTDVPVDGGSNTQDGPNSADGEVQLDLEVVGAVAPGAAYRIYFCENTDQSFLNALDKAARECNGVCISWGASENQWTSGAMDAFERIIKQARSRGVPVFVAAGDTGATDSSQAGVQVDFPASAPSAIGCGGTTLKLDAQEHRKSETVWNDSTWLHASATGGGVSKYFPGRQVPDIAGNADPDTGYQIAVDGQDAVVGGTSAVAPLMLGLHALLSELTSDPFDFANLIATNPDCCFDVTIGNNGGYRAGPGRDECTGYGVPDGTRLLAALTGNTPPPAPPSRPTKPKPPPAKPTPKRQPTEFEGSTGDGRTFHGAIEIS